MGLSAPHDEPDDLSVSKEETAVLVPWQERYAEWMVAQQDLPSAVDRAKKVSKLIGRQVKPYELSRVEKMPAFRKYVLTVMGEVGRQARAVLTDAATKAMLGHIQAIDELTASGDWKTLHKYTTPILDRVWPKREEGEVQRSVVVINFPQQSFSGKHLGDGLEGKVEIVVQEG